MREIIRAEHSGFCFGVKRAIKAGEELIEQKNVKGRIFTCGPLIHNERVTQDLENRGLAIINSLDEALKGDTVLIRSHGEPKCFYEQAEKRGIELVDATCPFVKKIHNLVEEANKAGKICIIIGDKTHPEIIGISGWCNNKAYIINSEEDASNFPIDIIAEQLLISENSEIILYVVAQTTIRKEHFEKLVSIIKDKAAKYKVDIEIENTICSATDERQNSCKDTAKSVDAMIVIGGKNSSNSKKLYEIASKYCTKSYFIENFKDLPLKEVEFCNKIGVAAGASTPECAIEEVIANMSEFTLENEKNLMHEFMDEIDKSLRLPRTGDIVNGKVLQVTEKEVIVNLGCKKDGIIPKDEVSVEDNQKLADLFKEGDEIQAKVIRTDDGDIILSKKKLEINEHWDEINDALENKSIINVKVVKLVNGGVIATYKEVSGFIPLSQLADRFVENAEEYLGKVLEVRVTKVDKMKGKAVFSHKLVLTEEKTKKIEELWGRLAVGDVVEGTVMRFTDYGAFVDIGGVDGLLHISEISWGKLKHPQEVLNIGQKVSVKILSMNAEKGKISLGLKQNTPEPWTVINEKYQVGQVVSGNVVQIKEYGAFVELEPGLDGLVHISEVAHKRVTNIADEISIGQEVSAEILDIDTERKRISLSIKATLEAPVQEEAPVEEAVEEVEA